MFEFPAKKGVLSFHRVLELGQGLFDGLEHRPELIFCHLGLFRSGALPEPLDDLEGLFFPSGQDHIAVEAEQSEVGLLLGRQETSERQEVLFAGAVIAHVGRRDPP